jgi:hypothetical protein
MPTQLQLRRGNTAQTATFTGAVAEITVDTDKKTVVVHDGTTAGGFALALESAQLDQFAFTKANLAFDRANSSFAQANLAYDLANTKFNSAGGTISGNVIVTGNVTPTTDNVYSLGSAGNRWKDLFVGPGSINIDGIVIGNTGGQIVISGASDFVFQSTSGAPSVSTAASANIALNAFNQANLAFNQANTSYGSFAQANLAYEQANASFGVAVSAFAQANLAFTAANNAVDTWVRNQANTAYDQANNAFAQANLAFTAANNAVDTWVRNQANSAYDRANSSFAQANLAYNTANAALPKLGGTITGDLTVSGNLVITGNTTTLNVSSLTVTDTLIQLGVDNQNDLLDIGFIGHYANTPNNHTGLIRKFTDGKYYLFDSYTPGAPGVEPTNIIDVANTRVATLSANLVTNVITLRGVDPLDYANTIYTNSQANTGNAVITLTSGYQANVGAGLIDVTSAYQANVGAGLITKVAKSGDVMTGGLSANGALIGASLTSNTIATINTNAIYESTAVTTAAATQFTLDSFSTTAYRSAKYLVQISSGSSYELLEMTLIHDGTTVYLSQYGNIKTDATLGVFDATISTGTLSLLATPNNAVTTFKTAITLIPV